MKDFWDKFLAENEFTVASSIELESRPEKTKQLPEFILNGPIRDDIGNLKSGDMVWSHQSDALKLLGDGKNTVVATGTASGKSLVFQLYAMHLIKSNPKARILVFYPLKALAADQYKRWQDFAKLFGLDENVVARIDGDIPTYSRDEILRTSNIILMTPDVCQSWFMRGIGSASHREFLANLALLVLDEAHVYESAFGSNVAMLLRRLISARRFVSNKSASEVNFQILAATATISDPAVHLHSLTGRRFEVITEEMNGAPQYDRIIYHLVDKARGASGEANLSFLITKIKELEQRNRFIAFVDSRQGTERVALAAGSENILPYRSGYESADRKVIEESLRSGKLQGVVSTSALELGIDIPDMQVGINMGVPNTKKSFRQRIGRIGRSAPGVFFLIAPEEAFLQFGETFEEYYNSSVEPSYLYTGNRFVQFAHAKCLFEEMDVLGQDKSALPAGVDWPEGFDKSLKIAKPGGARPREFDLVAQLGGDSPHFNYALRQIGEATYDLKPVKTSVNDRIGTIASNQAIREAYPGANYLHFGVGYKVYGWSLASFDRSIKIEKASKYIPTKPILRKTVTLGLDFTGIIEGRIKRSEKGLVSEVQLQVNESVEGYSIGSSRYLYKDLRIDNPDMSRKQRDIRTTGIVIKLNEPWFAGSSPTAVGNREAVAQAFMQLLCREKSIAPNDVDCVHTNIAILSDGSPKKATDSIVIYDTVYGGLRLTEDLYHKFSEFATQLSKAASMAGSGALVRDDISEKIKQWANELEVSDIISNEVPMLEDGQLMVYKPGSQIGVYNQGQLFSYEVITPKLIDNPVGDGTKVLVYIYDHNGKKSSVKHEDVHSTGIESNMIFWDPESNVFQELDDNEDQVTDANEGSFLKVFKPGSEVEVPYYGRYVKRKLLNPKLVESEDGTKNVQYEFADDNGVAFIMHDHIHKTGQEWAMIGWNPETNKFKELS